MRERGAENRGAPGPAPGSPLRSGLFNRWRGRGGAGSSVVPRELPLPPLGGPRPPLQRPRRAGGVCGGAGARGGRCVVAERGPAGWGGRFAAAWASGQVLGQIGPFVVVINTFLKTHLRLSCSVIGNKRALMQQRG